MATLCLWALLWTSAAQTPAPAQATSVPPVTLTMEVFRPGSETPLAAGSRLAVGEVLEVHLRMAMPLAFRDEQLITRWRLPLDLPVELITPWRDAATEVSGLRPLAPLAIPSAAQRTTVLDREVSVVEAVGETDDLARYRWRQRLRVEHVGAVELAPARLAATWATRFEEDMVRGRVPLDRQQGESQSSPWTATAQPLPPPPPGHAFHGAVGRFRGEWECQEADDGSWSLSMTLRGRGDLTPEALPALSRLPGFTVRALHREALADGVLLQAELIALPAVDQLPALAWTYFDPASFSYQQLHFPALAPGAGPAAATVIAAGAASPHGVDASTSGWRWWWWLLLPTVLLMALLWRRRSPSPSASIASAVAPAAPPPDLFACLAQALELEASTVFTIDLGPRLQALGIPADLADELKAAVVAHLQARYAEQGEGPSAESLANLRARFLAAYDSGKSSSS